MEIKTEFINVNRVKITVYGVIDMFSSPAFKAELMENEKIKNCDVSLDLENVDYIDSTGLGILLSATYIFRNQKRNLDIVKVSSMTRETFKLGNFDKFLNIKEEQHG